MFYQHISPIFESMTNASQPHIFFRNFFIASWVAFLCFCFNTFSQTLDYGTYQFDTVPIKMKPLGVEDFIKAIQKDTSLYRAFKNLRVFNHLEYSKVAVMDKKGGEKALLSRTTKHHNKNNFSWVTVEKEKVEGKYYDRKGEHRYLTARMFDYVFLPQDTAFASNTVLNPYKQKDMDDLSTMDKYYEQLKTFVFSPGTGVDGVMFIGDKLDIFSKEMRPLYDFSLDKITIEDSIPCYKFLCKKKDEVSDQKVVIQYIETIYDRRTMNIIRRKYRVVDSHLAFDFDITMSVELQKIGNEYFPVFVKYAGDWDTILQRRERIGFTIYTKLLE